MKKFSEWVEKYESENNGRVIFTVIDNKKNIMGFYEKETYNRGDMESRNTYDVYCNCNCRLILVEENLAWTKVTCEIMEDVHDSMNIIEDIRKFIEKNINQNNKYNFGACYLYDNTDAYTEVSVAFEAYNSDNYKKLLAFLASTDYILVKTNICTYGCIIRGYK